MSLNAYKVVSAADSDALEEEVAVFLANGYIPTGGITVSVELKRVFQAMYIPPNMDDLK